MSRGQTTDKYNVHQMAVLMVKMGIEQVVFSPGSRNAPMVIAFHAVESLECICLVDERAAAFFALGLAQQSRKPVAIVCTSGTAALNYAPAIAEAYYQEIPLLVLTADRPTEWIDQADMQSLRQPRIYANYIKRSFELPLHDATETDRWHARRTVCEAINHTQFPTPGPVHINVPLREPLYNLVAVEDLDDEAIRPIATVALADKLDENVFDQLNKIWQTSRKILIVVGVHEPDEQLADWLERAAEQYGALVLTETISNLNRPAFLPAIDRVVDTLTAEQLTELRPDLVVTLGGMIVSKKLKTFLRQNPPKYHWDFDQNYRHQDTFQSLTHIVPARPHGFFEQLFSTNYNIENRSADYINKFKKIDLQRAKTQRRYLAQLEFCDFTVMRDLLAHQPENSVFQFGNSTPIRYANLFGIAPENGQVSFANRGVGGIDGAASTASGFAFNTDKIVTHITGDLAFFYDSNALWNRRLPRNLRIVMINNSGGNIFRIIPGPTKSGYLEGFFEHQQQLSARLLCENFGVDYRFADSQATLDEVLTDFYEMSETARVLEIATDSERSAAALRNYFDYLRRHSD